MAQSGINHHPRRQFRPAVTKAVTNSSPPCQYAREPAGRKIMTAKSMRPESNFISDCANNVLFIHNDHLQYHSIPKVRIFRLNKQKKSYLNGILCKFVFNRDKSYGYSTYKKPCRFNQEGV